MTHKILPWGVNLEGVLTSSPSWTCISQSEAATRANAGNVGKMDMST
jgi:hypothetical protein